MVEKYPCFRTTMLDLVEGAVTGLFKNLTLLYRGPASCHLQGADIRKPIRRHCYTCCKSVAKIESAYYLLLHMPKGAQKESV